MESISAWRSMAVCNTSRCEPSCSMTPTPTCCVSATYIARSEDARVSQPECTNLMRSLAPRPSPHPWVPCARVSQPECTNLMRSLAPPPIPTPVGAMRPHRTPLRLPPSCPESHFLQAPASFRSPLPPNLTFHLPPPSHLPHPPKPFRLRGPVPPHFPPALPSPALPFPALPFPSSPSSASLEVHASAGTGGSAHHAARIVEGVKPTSPRILGQQRLRIHQRRRGKGGLGWGWKGGAGGRRGER